MPALLHAADEPDYRNPQAPLEQRVNSLFQAMTPEERITLVSGDGHMSTKSIPRLGVPAMTTADATQGVRGGSHTTDGSATLFTSGVLMASTWDLDLASQIGQGVGTEALNKGTGSQILLGPGVNILRTPFGGRTGEYLGGEDPYVASRMAVAYITGLQQTGCAACVKHYACNNQEFMRGGIDVRVSERALREIYTPAFIAAVKEGHVWSVMSAYNQVNGVYCSGNWYLQKEILDHEAGFDGIIMSDWGGVHDTLALNDGCDLAMPGHGVFEPQLVSAALQSGDLLQANVDDAVKRVIRTIIRVGLLDKTRVPDPAQINTPEHQHLALEAAEKGMVLLKNAQNILPLDTNKIHSIALIGPACKQWQMGTRGSAYVKPVQSVSAYDGIVARAGSGIDISFNEGYDENYTGEPVPTSALTADADETNGSTTASVPGGHGLMGEYFAGTDFSHPPVSTHLDPNLDFYFTAAQLRSLGIKHDQFCARWTGTLTAPATGTFRMSLNSPLDKSGGRLFIDDKLVQDVWPGFNGDQIAGQIDLVEGQTYKVRIEYVNLDSENPFRWTWIQPGQNLFGAVTDAARKADVAVVFVGTSEGEFIDRTNFALTGVQDDMIRAVAAANPHTVVVLNNGAPVQVSGWIDQVPGLVEAYYPGQAGGTALAAILFGDVNPSGKLVYTIGKSRKDYPDYPHYPARPGTLNLAEGEPSGPGIIDYSEGIYVGYRSFDKTNIQPSFPFGYGLSYTTFQYAHMKLSNPNMAPSDRLAVTADITNTGVRAGAEVVELYMKPDQPRVDRPIRELKGFARVELQPGETKPVSFHVTARDFAYCDVPGKQWKADAGTYSLELGSSSRDLRAKTEVQLTADYTESVPGVGAQPPDDAAPSLTIGKTVTASSAQDGFTPFKAIDGRRDSRWSSDFSDPQWLEVDLGEPTLFDHASILWEEAFAKAYQLQVSDDGKSWTTVYTNNSGNGGREKFSFPPVTARWVRILGTKRATGFGYSIFDFGLYPPQKK